MNKNLLVQLFKMLDRGDEIPDVIIEPAIDMLKVVSMSAPEDAVAETWLIDALIATLEARDMEAAAKHANDLYSLLSKDLDKKDDELVDAPMTDEVSAMVDKACENIVEDIDERLALEALQKLHERWLFIPLAYKEHILVGMDQQRRKLLVIALNKKFGSLSEFVKAYEAIDVNGSILSACHNQWRIDTIEPAWLYMELSHHDMPDGNIEARMMVMPFEEMV